ncbi:MAG: hypothetical protein ABR498_00270 [Candidatus Dormibacteria bacterium]
MDRVLGLGEFAIEAPRAAPRVTSRAIPRVNVTLDPLRRRVTLAEKDWQHILDRHQEMRSLRSEVLRAVRHPTAQFERPGNEIWFYRAAVGPSAWIKVVVVYERGRGRVITAFPRRKLP